jgi:cell division protein FtsB
MFRRTTRPPPIDAPESTAPGRVARAASEPTVSADDPGAGPVELGPRVAGPDLAALPIVGITRRRMAAALGVVLAIWIVAAFARQVGEASAASARVEELGASNVAMQGEIDALERELSLIARQEYIEQQARGFGLGRGRETAFTMAADAPPLREDAPGSAAVRLGSEVTDVSPLERWLTLLFGPSN